MKKYLFVEAVCIVITVLFVIFSVSENRQTLRTADEITDEIIVLFDDETLTQRDSSFIREKLSIDLSLFSSYSYYSSDDIMNVSELFVGVLNSDSYESIKDSLNSYAEEKYNLFNGYAPEQAAYLDRYVLNEESGAIIFCVSRDADSIYDAFVKALD